jgi:hypothetical protein
MYITTLCVLSWLLFTVFTWSRSKCWFHTSSVKYSLEVSEEWTPEVLNHHFEWLHAGEHLKEQSLGITAHWKWYIATLQFLECSVTALRFMWEHTVYSGLCNVVISEPTITTQSRIFAALRHWKGGFWSRGQLGYVNHLPNKQNDSEHTKSNSQYVCLLMACKHLWEWPLLKKPWIDLLFFFCSRLQMTGTNRSDRW